MSESLTKADMQRIRATLQTALAAIELNLIGLSSLALGNATFDPAGNFTFKLIGTVASGMNSEASTYESLRKYEVPSLPPLGTEFTNGAARYKIIGAKNRSNKIIVELLAPLSNGTRYLYTHEAVLRLCNCGAA